MSCKQCEMDYRGSTEWKNCKNSGIADAEAQALHDGRKMDHSVCNKKLGPVLRLKSVDACLCGIISGPTIVFAEPLFFDCHGTFEHTYPDEKLENHHGPKIGPRRS